MSTYDFERVLTTGASGMIGAYVGFGMRPSRTELDVLDEDAVMRYVQECRPSAIIHLAAATDTNKCEQDPQYAHELNVRAAGNVARAAQEVGATMVLVSTSRVFKGDKPAPYTEDDTPEPETVYGRTKYEAELMVAAMSPNHIIARTAWVFGGGPKRDNKFYGNVLRKLRAQEEVKALNDVYGSPTYGKDFIEALKKLIESGERGLFHVANQGEATRYDIACALAAYVAPGAKIQAVDRSAFPTGASLPARESMESLKVALRPWQEALEEYLTDEWHIEPGSLY